MVTVRHLLMVKGNQVWTMSPDSTMLEVLRTLSEKNIGALLIMDGKQIAGIISERDIVRIVAKTGQCELDAPVKNHMTKGVYGVQIDQSISECMVLMTEKHIRHLPVLDRGQLVGLISIGDVVRQVISEHETTIQDLENYILNRGYGR